jgi:hypothetical protein
MRKLLGESFAHLFATRQASLTEYQPAASDQKSKIQTCFLAIDQNLKISMETRGPQTEACRPRREPQKHSDCRHFLRMIYRRQASKVLGGVRPVSANLSSSSAHWGR